MSTTRTRLALPFLVLLIAGAPLSTGCSRPPEPPPSSEESTEESRQSNSDSSESDSEVTDDTDSDAFESAVVEKSVQTPDVPDEPPTMEPPASSAPAAPTSSVGGDSKGGEADQIASDLNPATASEAARLAEEHLSLSEESSDLTVAYRNASIALHCARQFPGDAACLRLADAALARVRALESQAADTVPASRGGSLPEKTIVEIP